MTDHCESAGRALAVEKLPGGGVRTHGVADEAMVERIGYAYFSSLRWIWWALGIALILGPVVIGYFQDHTDGIPSVGYLGWVLILGCGIFLSFRFFLLHVSGPDYVRYEHNLSPGMPVHADFTPEWVGIGWQDNYVALDRSQLHRVSRHKSVLSIRGCETAIHVPEELLPAEATADSLSIVQHRTSDEAAGASHTTPPPLSYRADASGAAETVRTTATADATLASRLARSVRRSTAVKVATLLFLPFPIAGVVALIFDEEKSLVDSMFLPLVMLGGAGLGIIGYYVFVGAKRDFRKLIPEGAALAAEFRSDGLCVQLGGRVQEVGARAVKKVERVDSALVVYRERPNEGLLVPDELVPPHVAEDLLKRFGRSKPKR